MLLYSKFCLEHRSFATTLYCILLFPSLVVCRVYSKVLIGFVPGHQLDQNAERSIMKKKGTTTRATTTRHVSGSATCGDWHTLWASAGGAQFLPLRCCCNGRLPPLWLTFQDLVYFCNG